MVEEDEAAIKEGFAAIVTNIRRRSKKRKKKRKKEEEEEEEEEEKEAARVWVFGKQGLYISGAFLILTNNIWAIL